MKRRMIFFYTKFLYRETLFHNEVSHGSAQTSTSALYSFVKFKNIKI